MGATDIITILFTDLVQSTGALARLGEERADELRQTHFTLLRDAIADHRGVEVKNLGDGLMVAFTSASDAVGCAVAMQQAIERHNRRGGEPLHMRVGVAVGEATCEESDYFGTPVVEASRLCSKAEGGQILVTDMVRALAGSRGGHRFESLGPVELKGLPDPVSIHHVGWEPAVADVALPPRLAATSSVAFVGRDAEREVLERAWKSAQQGARQVVFLAGEPGIGKTRLATEIALAAHRDGGVVLLGTCDEDLGLPYQPFVEALRHLVTVGPADELSGALAERGGQLVRLLPELPRLVPGLPPPQSADAEAERYLLFSAVADVLGTMSRWRPLVLLLDDLHWATKPTVLMLKHLVRTTGPEALLVLGTYRDSDISRDHPLAELLADLRREPDVGRLNLRGLSDGESVSLMEALAGHDLDPATLDLAHAVYEEADGSPFFMRELVRHLLEAGELVKVDDRWTYRGQLSALGIPDSVREVIGRRLSRLPGDVEELLRSAAVIGRRFDIAVLATSTGRPQPLVLEALEAARRAALVREVSGSPGRFTFAHALIRDTLYQELGQAQGMVLHRAVAQAMESLAAGHDETYLAELAYHWVAATPAVGVVPDDVVKAAGYSETAGRRAMASLAYEEAVHHFERALRAIGLTGDRLRRCELLISFGDAQRCAGDPTHRETLLEAGRLALESEDGDRAARAALANQRGFYSRYAGVDTERVAALEAVLEAIGPDSTTQRARIMASLASELHFASAERRLELGRGAVTIARAAGDPLTLAQALGAGWFATWGTDDSERPALAAELSDLAGRLPDLSVQFEAAVAVFLTAQGQGDVGRAAAALETCGRIAEELGQPALRWRAAYFQAHFAMLSEPFEVVERLAGESHRLGQAAGQPEASAFGQAPPLIIRFWQGEWANANAISAAVHEQFPAAVSFQLTSAWSQALLGRFEEARRAVTPLWADDFAGIARDSLWLLHSDFSARIACLTGDDAAAQRLYEMLLPHRSSLVMSQTIWFEPAALVLGIVATTLRRYDDADGHFRRAIEIQERIGRPPTLVHTRLEWARMLLRRDGPGDAQQARVLLETARPHARELGLTGIEPDLEALYSQTVSSG